MAGSLLRAGNPVVTKRSLLPPTEPMKDWGTEFEQSLHSSLPLFPHPY